MGTVKAIWKNGAVVLSDKVDWPDGLRLIVAEDSLSDIAFMTEEEQDDNPDAVEMWINDIKSMPTISSELAEQPDQAAWTRKMKDFNVDAVRRQMTV